MEAVSLTWQQSAHLTFSASQNLEVQMLFNTHHHQQRGVSTSGPFIIPCETC